MRFGLCYLLLLCDAPRNSSVDHIAPSNSSKNCNSNLHVRAVDGGSDKRKREVDLDAILQDVQTRLPKGVPLPPIFHSDDKKDRAVGNTNKGGERHISSFAVHPTFARLGLNKTEVQRNDRLDKGLDSTDSVEDYDTADASVNISEPPPRKFNLRRRPVIIPRQKYEGGYYRRRYPRRRIPYSRIRYIPFYDSEELPNSAEYFDDYEDSVYSPPPVKTMKRRHRVSAETQHESQDLRERLKEVLKQILSEANRQKNPGSIDMATDCHKKPVVRSYD